MARCDSSDRGVNNIDNDDRNRPVVNQIGNNSANNRCNRRTNGIVDTNLFSNNICILADRVFDGVRMDLDQAVTILTLDTTDGSTDPITFESAHSTTSQCKLDNLRTAPFDAVYSIVQCDIIAFGTCTFLQNDIRKTANCSLIIPYSALMKLPEDSILPFDINPQCAFTADTGTQVEGNKFTVLADGVVIVLITGQLPIFIPYISQFLPASIAQRQFSAVNDLLTMPVFPSATLNTTNSPPFSCDPNDCPNSTM